MNTVRWHSESEKSANLVIFQFISSFTELVTPGLLSMIFLSEVRYEGGTDQKGEAADANAIGMHGIVMLL
jgi:hypothetical protein